MSETLVIAKGVTLRTLNPHNTALKNDFNENLLVTAFSVFPTAAKMIGNRKFRIIRGFESHGYIMNEVSKIASADLLRHSRGMAVEFTWEKCTEDERMAMAILLYDSIEEPVKIIVNHENNSIYVGRGVENSMIIENSSNQNKVIRKAA